MAIWILRCAFLLTAAGLGASIINQQAFASAPFMNGWLLFVIIVGISAATIAIDVFIPTKRIEIISCVYFGIFVGLFLTFGAMQVVEPIILTGPADSVGANQQLQLATVKFVLGLVLCYTCISVLLQTKDDFRFIIPYVEFSKEVKGIKPYVLDTSVVIDGRIADVVETSIFDNQLIMPRFVLSELQAIADSSDKLRRARGRRGLDILNRLRNNSAADMKIYDRELPEMAGQPVDMKLVLLAKHLEGKVVTGDYNLNKVARIHNVPVINLNDIANSLKPVFLPGEHFTVKIVKPGEEPGQGVGYLDDGTMIVVEAGREYIGKVVQIAVTSVLQTSAGRMIFGRYESSAN